MYIRCSTEQVLQVAHFIILKKGAIYEARIAREENVLAETVFMF